MPLRTYQLAELFGIILVLGATAIQTFHLEPLKRQIEWRQNVFTQQQNGHVLAEAVFDNRIAILTVLKADVAEIQREEDERRKLMDRYKTAHANVAADFSCPVIIAYAEIPRSGLRIAIVDGRSLGVSSSGLSRGPRSLRRKGGCDPCTPAIDRRPRSRGSMDPGHKAEDDNRYIV